MVPAWLSLLLILSVKLVISGSRLFMSRWIKPSFLIFESRHLIKDIGVYANVQDSMIYNVSSSQNWHLMIVNIY